MLIRFKVSNFLSFKEETEFSMVAGKERLHPNHVIKGEKNQPNLLRAALLYGANAAGKSNFVKAINTLKERVLGSPSNFPFMEGITPGTFKLDNFSNIQTFEVEFVSNERIYNYNFIDAFDTIVKETLVDLTNGKEIILIDRRKNSKDEIGFFKTDFLKNKEEKDFLKFVQRSTKPNKLFLTHSLENNAEWFRDVFRWFENSLQVIFPNTSDLKLAERLRNNQDFKEYFTSTIQKAGTGISSIEVMTFAEAHKVLEDRVNEIKERTKKESIYEEILKNRFEILSALMTIDEIKSKAEKQNLIQFFHGNRLFNDIEESDGTQRLFHLAFPFYDLATSETPKVYIIDELERNLHTNLSYTLLKSYLEQEGKGQLIATTHDTHLLDLDLLRRDEIWFAEKDEHGATQLYSLYDFNPRYDKDIEKDYLLGRYGAIPFLGNLEFKRKLGKQSKNGKSKNNGEK